MPLTSVSGMHVTGRLKLSDPPSEGTPRRVTQLSQYGGNLTIVLEVQFHGFHAFFTRVHGHPPFWSRILSAYPFVHFSSGDDTGGRSACGWHRRVGVAQRSKIPDHCVRFGGG